MKFKIFLKQLFCSHISKTEIIEKGETVFTKLPKDYDGEFLDYTLDIVKETCYKCRAVKFKQKRKFKDGNILYTL